MKGMNELALFAGAGGGILGGHLLGWRTICAVEIDPYARRVLLSRQRDGCLARFPIWDDITTFSGHPWRGHIDVISGGFPCQDISCAGKGAGIDGERSGLWGEMFRVVREVGPRFVFVENSPMLTIRGLGRVLGDLASLGYDARWGVLGADDAGAPHRRKRIWILADSYGSGFPDVCNGRGMLNSGTDKSSKTQRIPVVSGDCGAREDGDVANPHRVGSGAWPRLPEGTERETVSDPDRGSRCCSESMADSDSNTAQGLEPGPQQSGDGRPAGLQGGTRGGNRWWDSEPDLGRVAHGLATGVDIHGTHAGINVDRVAKGVPSRVKRLKAIGNGQVPATAATAWRILT